MGEGTYPPARFDTVRAVPRSRRTRNAGSGTSMPVRDGKLCTVLPRFHKETMWEGSQLKSRMGMNPYTIRTKPTKLKEPGFQARPFQFLRRRREIALRIQLYHAPPHSAGRVSYGTQTNARRFA